MKSNIKIFCDLDGVLADFYKYIGKFTREEWFNGGFTQFIEERGFTKLELFPDTLKFIKFLTDNFKTVIILTSAGKNWGEVYEEIADQKFEWLAENGIDLSAIVVHQKEDKQKYATPKSVLIDDQVFNTQSFLDAGGMSILHVNIESTIQILTMLLEKE
jgi:hypothetical protein